MTKEFNIPNHYDFEVKEDGSVVGTIRVKPSAISWAPKGSHHWHSVRLDEFGDFAEKNGKKRTK